MSSRAPPPPGRGNLQAWARDLRYARALEHAGGALIATGHTASDQAETVLYRLASSPGRRALLGIAAREGRLIRPLLAVTREETAAYCRERGLRWREDSSNASDRFARGRIRHRLLEDLRDVHPAAEANVVRSAEILRAEADVLDEVVRVALAGRARIALERLRALPPALARLVVIRLAEDAAGAPVGGIGGRLDELLALGRAGGSAALDVGGGVRALVEYGVLRFEPRAAPGAAPAPVALALPGSAAFGAWELRCAVVPAGERAAPSRGRRAARRRAPRRRGADGAVLARRRPDAPARARRQPRRSPTSSPPAACRGRSAPTLPLLERDGEIAWIPGVATAERFRVDDRTRRVAVLRAARR